MKVYRSNKSKCKDCLLRSTCIGTSDFKKIESTIHKPLYDAMYEKLSKVLLLNTEYILPAFASHNVRSLSHACIFASKNNISKTAFELQMLYGMADPIAEAFKNEGYLCRLYAPLGELIPGMGYLVRRLLENTSNESFLRHTFFEGSEVEFLLKEPQFKE